MAHKSQVWVADDDDAFARAQILNEKDDGTTIVQIEGRMGDTTLPTDQCFKVNPENQDGGAFARFVLSQPLLERTPLERLQRRRGPQSRGLCPPTVCLRTTHPSPASTSSPCRGLCYHF